MTLDEAMAALEAMGTEQNRAIYRRHGAGDNQFGVSFANLKGLAKKIKTDRPLAEALWQTGNADARALACHIADPKVMTSKDLDAWADDIDYYVVADAFVRHLVSRSPLALEKVEIWAGAEAEYVGQCGWELLSLVAMQEKSLPDAYFQPYIESIESKISSAVNRARYAMNSALIAIGLRNVALREDCLAVAARIGKVEVDHGETGCKTPDAAAYIKKAWARRLA